VLRDGGFNHATQTRVFPLVHAFLARGAEFEDAQRAFHAAEVAARDVDRRLYEVRAARATQQPVPGCRAGATKADAAAAERALRQEWEAAQRQLRPLRVTFRATLQACFDAYHDVRNAPLDGDGAPASAAAAAAGAPRLFRCAGAACGGTYPADGGVCLVCQLAHCARCAQPLPDACADADAAGGAAAEAPARHACRPDDVASLRFVVSSTRDCPRCRTRITRASGCDQMMCTACNCVFSWASGAEERGVIHNPHFHALSTDARQRVLDDRAARGIASTREQRFLAGVGAGARAPRCEEGDDGNGAEAFDPECEPFDSAAFDAAVRRALPAGAGRDAAVELYRLVMHHGAAEAPRLAEALRAPALGERGARLARVARLRGAALRPPVHITHGHPDGYKALAWLLPPLTGVAPPSDAAFAAQLMRADTERAKLAAQLQLSETFADAGRGLLRLLLGAVPSERRGVLDALQALADETERLSAEARSSKAAAKKRAGQARGGAANKRAKRGGERDSSDDEEEEEQSDSAGSDDDDDDDDD
jgi:hypothetical protein